MQLKVKVFVLSPLRGPGQTPKAGPELTVEGSTHDAIRVAAVKALTARGYKVRAMSFSASSLLAYVEGEA